MVGTADSVVIKEVSFIQCPLWRGSTVLYCIHTTFLWCCACRLQRGVLPTDVFGVKVCDGGSEEPSHSIPELASDADGGTTCGAEGIKGRLCTTQME